MARLTFLSCVWTESQFNPGRKNKAHVKWSAISTLMVGLGGRTNSPQAKQSGSNIYDVLEWIIGIGLHSQRLNWRLPNLRTPEQSERWSDLMPPRSWQLWLARDLVVENVLPWQSATINLTPGRVCSINVVAFS